MSIQLKHFISYFVFIFLMLPHPPLSTLFPYTTLLPIFAGAVDVDPILPDADDFELRNRLSDAQGFAKIAVGSVEKCLQDRKSTRLNSSHSQISYAVFCLKKKKLPN